MDFQGKIFARRRVVLAISQSEMPTYFLKMRRVARPAVAGVRNVNTNHGGFFTNCFVNRKIRVAGTGNFLHNAQLLS